jgi:hypothetical protein
MDQIKSTYNPERRTRKRKPSVMTQLTRMTQ